MTGINWTVLGICCEIISTDKEKKKGTALWQLGWDLRVLSKKESQNCELQVE